MYINISVNNVYNENHTMQSVVAVLYWVDKSLIDYLSIHPKNPEDPVINHHIWTSKCDLCSTGLPLALKFPWHSHSLLWLDYLLTQIKIHCKVCFAVIITSVFPSVNNAVLLCREKLPLYRDCNPNPEHNLIKLQIPAPCLWVLYERLMSNVV